MQSSYISFDFKTGEFSGATLVERLGLGIMRMAANLLASREFVGFSWVGKIVSTVLPSKRNVRVIFEDDCLFEFPYGDGYWGILLYNKDWYGPDVDPYLMALADVDYSFIDCGSNFGYMSVLVTSSKFGSNSAIAIEADPINFKRSSHNSEINGDRYECRHNAIFSKSGEMVSLFGAKHEARSIVNDGSEEVASGDLETLAIDDLRGWVKDNGGKPVVLKLDVEGVEIDAVKGATKLIDEDCLIIYEDHGNDKDHVTSRYMKDDAGMRIFLGRSDRTELSEMLEWANFDAMKTNPRRGYDLFATKSDFWIDKLSRFSASKQGAK